MTNNTESFPLSYFDKVIPRQGTASEKFDGRQRVFGDPNVHPLWVADMDFRPPPAVLEALQQRINHPIFGYSFAEESLYQALIHWYARRHQWTIDRSALMLSPGVVASLYAAVATLTEKDDAIIVPSPVYPPFFSAVQAHGRRVIPSELLRTDEGRYTFDLDHIEDAARNGATMLLLCSPHNPVGRVWREEELRALIDIALRYELVLVSDEIHCDLVFDGHRHIPLPTIAPKELRLLTAISPSKSFNIPGLQLSALVFSHEVDQRAVQSFFQRAAVHPAHPLTLAAFEAAYQSGDAWLDALLSYLDARRHQVHQSIHASSLLRADLPEATCLTWIDASALQESPAGQRDFFVNEARLGLNEGRSFGPGGSHHMRLNFGTQETTLGVALDGLRTALERRR